MDISAVFEFGWVMLFAALAGMLSVRLNLPPVAGLLIAGMVIGPNVLHLVELPTIATFAEIGSILLLFMIGVEFSITKLLSTGLRAVIGSMLLIFLTFTIMHEIAILLGFDQLTSLFIGSMFAMSSTAIIMKILEQKRLAERQEIPVLVAMLIVEDIVAVFMLTFFSSLKTAPYGGESILAAIIVSLAVLAFVYVILLRVLQKFSIMFLRYQAEDTLILFSFTLGIGMSVAASLLGLTPAIGAFLAGSIVAGLPNGRDFEHAIRPFSHVFSSFFFLSVGMLIDPMTIFASADLTLMLIGSFMVTVFLAVAFTFFMLSSSGRSSVFSGLAMLPLGEFSLLIAREGTGVVSTNLVGIASAGVLLTSLACSFAISRSEHFYVWLKANLPEKVVFGLKNASDYFISVISSFEPHGYFHKLFMAEVRKGATDILYVVGVATFFIAIRPFLQFQVGLMGYMAPAEIYLLAILALVSMIPLVRLALSLKRLFDALSLIFSRTTPIMAKSAIMRNVIIGTILLLIFANFYLFVELFALPRIFNWLSIIAGLLSVFFFWSAVRASSIWLLITKYRPVSILRQKILASEEDFVFAVSPLREAKTAASKLDPHIKQKLSTLHNLKLLQTGEVDSEQLKKIRKKISFMEKRSDRNHGFGRL